MEENYIAFIKGSKKTRKLRLGVIVKLADSGQVVFEYSEKVTSDIDTSAREEYRAILLAVKSVPIGSRITIYTNNITAVNVFSGDWNAKKHKDIVNEFFQNCDMKNVVVLLAGESLDDEVRNGMKEAEILCWKAK